MQTLFIPLDVEPHPPRLALTGTQPPSLAGVLGAPVNIEAGFFRAATCEALAALTTGKLTLKKKGGRAGDALFTDITMSVDGTGADTRYQFAGLLNTNELIAAIGEEDSIVLVGSIAWTEPGEDEDKCIDFEFTLYNSSIRPGDSIPAGTAEQLAWLTAQGERLLRNVSGLTGGGSTNLDGAVEPTTADIGAIYTLYIVGASSPYQKWRVFAGTDAEDAANGIVRPDNFHASTNAVVLKQII